MKYSISYIGNYYKVSEMIFHNDKLELVSIFCEKSKVSDDLITFALVRNIPIYKVSTKEELQRLIEKENEVVDFFIMCSFGKRVPLELLSGVDIYNIHYSQLPYYKGRHPTFWATVSCEKKLGISIHKITSKIDEGEIIAQRNIPYYIWMNENEIFDKLTEEVPVLLNSVVDYIENTTEVIKNMPGNYYPVVSEYDYTINIESDSFEVIYNKIRAQSKYSGGKVHLDKKVCWIKNIKFTEYKIGEKKYLIKDGYLLIKINNEICIKTSDFEFKEEII